MLLNATQLTSPVALERSRPLMQRPQRISIGAIQHVASVTADVNQPDVAQHLQMLRNGRLSYPKRSGDVVDAAFLRGEKFENLAATRFRDGVERIGGRCGSRHSDDHIPIQEYVKR